MSHYYTNDPNLGSNEKEFKIEILEKNFKFVTDSGVFSKGELDYASNLLLKTFLKENPTGNILDVGCGYGALGIVVGSFLPKSTVDMTDINLRAINLARKNAVINQVDNVEIYESNLYDKVEKKFHHILSNPPIRAGKSVVHAILTDAINYLHDSGTLTIVIGKQHGAASAEKKMKEIFGNVTLLERKKGFWILQSSKEEL